MRGYNEGVVAISVAGMDHGAECTPVGLTLRSAVAKADPAADSGSPHGQSSLYRMPKPRVYRI